MSIETRKKQKFNLITMLNMIAFSTALTILMLVRSVQSGVSMLIQEVELMLNNPTVEKLRELKLKVMAEIMSEPDHELMEMTFEERLGIMVEKEWLSKKNTRIKRLLDSATLGVNACIEDINYLNDRTIDKKQYRLYQHVHSLNRDLI